MRGVVVDRAAHHAVYSDVSRGSDVGDWVGVDVHLGVSVRSGLPLLLLVHSPQLLLDDFKVVVQMSY